VAIAAVSRPHIAMLTGLAMLAFAGNSLLCRFALKNTAIDAASFTSIRLVAAAITLGFLVRAGDKSILAGGNWLSALALFAYAAGFSFAYINLTAATGALLLFGAVQITMVSYGIAKGERLLVLQLMGLTLALGGLVGLLLPGLAAPPLVSSVLMIGAGMAWGVYSLRGRGAGDPAVITAGNFLRTIPVTLTLSLVMVHHVSLDSSGIIYAILSGAVTSGMGYAIWYKALPALQATHAATVQLSVPVIAALGGIILLGETLTLRFVLASLAILCGIAMVIFEKAKSKNA
jgi:drug/metabolite transporter (DMT)-like permease